jgi:hypothetical protein
MCIVHCHPSVAKGFAILDPAVKAAVPPGPFPGWMIGGRWFVGANALPPPAVPAVHAAAVAAAAPANGAPVPLQHCFAALVGHIPAPGKT